MAAVGPMVSSARELLQRRRFSQCMWWQEAARVEKAAAENQQLRAALAERTDFQLKGRSAPLGLVAVMPTGEERARAFSSDSSGSAKHCEAPLGPFLCGLCAEELWLGLALPHSIHTTAEID